MVLRQLLIQFQYIFFERQMEETFFTHSNNDGQLFKLEIKQKSLQIKKRKVKTWTSEEDQKLTSLYNQYPKKWNHISSLMNDRNENQCLHRYRRLSQMGFQKKIWSTEEDQKILKLIKEVGKNWKLLSEVLGTKTGKQIRERYINKLDPKIKVDEWTDEEDKMILKYYSELGSRWSEISKRIPGRPENKIKNRFYSYIQKNYQIKLKMINQAEQKSQLASQKKSNECLPIPQEQDLKAPSINQLDEELKIYSDHNHEDYGSVLQINSGNKLYLKSLIRMEEEGLDENKWRSIRELVSNNDVGNENDLFYLSN